MSSQPTGVPILEDLPPVEGKQVLVRTDVTGGGIAPLCTTIGGGLVRATALVVESADRGLQNIRVHAIVDLETV